MRPNSISFLLVKKHTIPLVLAIISSILIYGDEKEKPTPAPRREDPLQPTAEIQKALDPEEVLEILMAGNEKYVEGVLRNVDIGARRDRAVEGQFPKAYILSCVDSRVPVEKVFNLSIGDIFVGRVAGNIETTEQLGSMEFASAVSGVKIIMVLGHDACGAVKGACDKVKLGNLTALLNQIQPAIDQVEGHAGDRSSNNAKFVDDVIKQNVLTTVSDIRKRSPVLLKLKKDRKIKIVGGVYSLATGKVTLLD
jgi:carbonic anhydrase